LLTATSRTVSFRQGDRPDRRSGQPVAHPPHDHASAYRQIEQDIASIRAEKEAALERQNFEVAKKLADQEQTKLEAKTALELEWRQRRRSVDVVDEDVIAEVLANWTDPVYKLTEQEPRTRPDGRGAHKRIVGQRTLSAP